MGKNVKKVLLCFNGEKDENKFILDRAEVLLRYALESQNIEYTYDPREDYDLVHLFSINQYKAYLSSLGRRTKRKPVIISGFTDSKEIDIKIDDDGEYRFDIQKIIKGLNGIDGFIIPWKSQDLILTHFNVPFNHYLCPLGSKTYNEKDYSNIEKEAFRRYYKLDKNAKIIFTYGDYIYSHGIDTLESIARIMPEYEFFFFGGKSGVLSNSRHYEKANNIVNLHYEDHIHRELYHSLLMSSTALFLPYKFHNDSVLILEAMKAKIPVISDKTPFLYDLLIKNKTALIGSTVEEFYNHLKNVETTNYKEEAYELVKDFTPESYGEALKTIYDEVIKYKV